jgi:hypothetical protein
MGKKYLLTFSLAAISCLATKSLQSVLHVVHAEQQVEIVDNESSVIEPQTGLILESNLKVY